MCQIYCLSDDEKIFWYLGAGFEIFEKQKCSHTKKYQNFDIRECILLYYPCAKSDTTA